MNEKETTDKLKVCIQNLNAILKECKNKGISVAFDVNYPNKKDTVYAHKNNNVTFGIREIYE